MSDVLKVGDRMCFSLELIQALTEAPEYPKTAIVVVRDIRTWSDGTKVVALALEEPQR